VLPGLGKCLPLDNYVNTVKSDQNNPAKVKFPRWGIDIDEKAFANMGSHPLNLTLRFLLELAALGAMGY